MMVMEAVREIVKKCPYLDEYYKSLSVDRLGKDSTSYSIDSVPGQQVTKRDIAGNTTRQCLFNFSSREVSEAGDFPELDAGKTIKKIEAITCGYVFDTELDKAKYQIQCRIIYKQEARR